MCGVKICSPTTFGVMLWYIIKQDMISSSLYVLKKSLFLSAFKTVEILYLLSCLLRVNGFVLTKFK